MHVQYQGCAVARGTNFLLADTFCTCLLTRTVKVKVHVQSKLRTVHKQISMKSLMHVEEQTCLVHVVMFLLNIYLAS